MNEANYYITVNIEPSEDNSYLGSPFFYKLFKHNNNSAPTLIGTCIMYDSRIDPAYSYSDNDDEYSECKSYFYEKAGLGSINSLYIEEEYRGKGFGYTLLHFVLSHCKIMDLRYVDVNDVTDLYGTERSIYHRFGFMPDTDDNHLVLDLEMTSF